MSGRALTLAVAGAAAALLTAAGPAAADAPGEPPVKAPHWAACDPVSGTAAVTVVYRDPAGAPAPAVLAVRFASGLRGPVLAEHRFPAGTRPGTAHTFHVQWLPGGAYYLDDGTGAGDARTVVVPAETCTVRAPGQAVGTAAYVDVSGSAAPPADGALAHTGGGSPAALLATAAGALALGAAGLAAARRLRPAAR